MKRTGAPLRAPISFLGSLRAGSTQKLVSEAIGRLARSCSGTQQVDDCHSERRPRRKGMGLSLPRTAHAVGPNLDSGRGRAYSQAVDEGRETGSTAWVTCCPYLPRTERYPQQTMDELRRLLVVTTRSGRLRSDRGGTWRRHPALSLGGLHTAGGGKGPIDGLTKRHLRSST